MILKDFLKILKGFLNILKDFLKILKDSLRIFKIWHAKTVWIDIQKRCFRAPDDVVQTTPASGPIQLL